MPPKARYSKIINIKVSPITRDIITRIADRHDVTISEVARDLLQAGIEAKGVTASAAR